MIGLSVCSGIGAPEVSSPWIDWRYHSEIEPFPVEVFAQRFPHSRNLGDMTGFKDWPDEKIDILCGGTPCQSFSIAGLRKGMDDPRGNLMLTYLAIAAQYRPGLLVWENVPGVLSADNGRAFASLIEGLAKLGYGYAWRVFDSQHCRTYGFPFAVPQRRRRVFLVGCLGDWRRAAAILFDAESMRRNSAPRRETGQGVAVDVVPSIVGSGRGVARIGETRGQDPVVAVPPVDLIMSHDPSVTLTARDRKGPLPEADLSTIVAHTLRAEGFDASEDGTGRGTPIVPVGFSSKDYGADAMQECSPTIRAGGHTSSHANAGVPPAVAFNAAQKWAVRRLTPTECERLMGFPDNWTRIAWRGKPSEQCPDGHRYKTLGNSWAVNCGQRVFEAIRRIHGL